MKSIIFSFVMAGLTGVAFAQAPPPPPEPAVVPQVAPPAGPAADAPPAPALPAIAAVPPAPPMPPMDFDFDFDFAFDGIRGGVPGGVMGGIAGGIDRMNMEYDRARDRMEMAKETMNKHRFEIEEGMEVLRGLNFGKMQDAWLLAQAGASTPRPAVAPMPPGAYAGRIGPVRGRGGSEERVYQRGTEYLDRREWDKAIDAFDQVIDNKGAKADGACYWKAYALSKTAQSDKALATLAELQKTYPSSRWLNDAKALEAEVRQNKGQPVSPEKENDEDLKLFAINSLINNDPERAVPLLQHILQSHNPPKVKERALFVLAQTQTPQARDVVIRFAKGGGNPDLQTKAVEYLGIYGGKQNMQLLSEIYAGSNDPSLRRSILQSFLRADDKDHLLSAARSEQNQELRTDAIRLLGRLGAQPELAQMYTAEASPEVKMAIIDAMYSAENVDKLVGIARSEKDPKLRAQAIHRLGNLHRSRTSDALVSMYSSETDRGIKEQIMRSLYNQNAVKELVDIARRESDPELKRAAVRYLSNMKSKEATDFLVELLNK